MTASIATQSQTDYPGALSSRTARVLAGVISIAAFAALGIQTTLNADTELSPLASAGLMLRYFTIWGNLAAAILMLHLARGKYVRADIMAALSTALAIIAVVYWALLSGYHDPIGLDRVTNQFHHTIIPAAVIAWWMAFSPKVASIPRALATIMAAPLIYTAFALIVGAMSGFYAYFFLDRNTLSWGEILLYQVGLAIFFALTGAALIAFKRLLRS